jgi:hypothetical protein
MIEQLIIHQIGLSSEIYLRLIELCKMVYVGRTTSYFDKEKCVLLSG